MLNEDKIKVMTSIAMIEKKYKKELEIYSTYFKNDYISNFLILKFFTYNVGVAVIAIIVLFNNMEPIVSSIYVKSIYNPITLYVLVYCIGLLIYMYISFLVSKRKYKKACVIVDEYFTLLKKLDKRYELYDRVEKLNSEEV